EAAEGRVVAALRADPRFVEAESLARRAVELNTRLRGPQHPVTLRAKDSLAAALRLSGRQEEAEAVMREVFELTRARLGDDAVETALAGLGLAEILGDLGRVTEALERARAAQAVLSPVIEPDHPNMQLTRQLIEVLELELKQEQAGAATRP
ncbi:MAG: tetratricopeptide repeat protein, partial [Myxococcales bacterium]|nr:tetratricopeptide repeat protein [Myxococcales bacterium]